MAEELGIAQTPGGLRQEIHGALKKRGAAHPQHALDRRVDAGPHAGPGDVRAEVTGQH